MKSYTFTLSINQLLLLLSEQKVLKRLFSLSVSGLHVCAESVRLCVVVCLFVLGPLTELVQDLL